MDMQKSIHDPVAERLARLERQWRRLATALVVAAFAFGVAVVEGTDLVRPRPTLEAGRIILRDDDGRVRARLEPVGDGMAMLTLSDAEGHSQVVLRSGADETAGLYLVDRGVTRSSWRNEGGRRVLSLRGDASERPHRPGEPVSILPRAVVVESESEASGAADGPDDRARDRPEAFVGLDPLGE